MVHVGTSYIFEPSHLFQKMILHSLFLLCHRLRVLCSDIWGCFYVFVIAQLNNFLSRTIFMFLEK